MRLVVGRGGVGVGIDGVSGGVGISVDGVSIGVDCRHQRRQRGRGRGRCVHVGHWY